MQALRQVQKVENGTLTIKLPAYITADEVEVIILHESPVESLPEQTPLHEAIQKFLTMDTSHFTDDEQKAYERTSHLIQQERRGSSSRRFGLYEGLGNIADDFDSLSNEEIDLFYVDNIFPEQSITNEPI